MVRFNAEGPDGLRDRKAPGPIPLLKAAHRAALLEIIESGPTPSIHGVVRWRITDLGRDNWLSNRVFDTCDDIVAHCCEAWNNLIDQPWRIISIGMRD